MIFRKKRINFLFLLINRLFYLSLSGGWTQKVGGTNDSPSPPLKKVVGTVSPPSYAHVTLRPNGEPFFYETNV